MDHIWPAELDSEARCERCGLSYSHWSMDELNCVLPGSTPADPPAEEGPAWIVQPGAANVVLVTYDEGAEWEETMVFGPFATLKDAESFAYQVESHSKVDNPDGTATARFAFQHAVTRV